MITQKDIDNFMLDIQSGKSITIYYAAHMIEGRETNILDEHSYKDVSRFKVIELKITNIENAYFKLLDFIKHPNDYHIEEETYYYHPSAKYIQQFIVPNTDDIILTPSIIYGKQRNVVDVKTGIIKEVIDPSPVKPVYTNTLEYGDMDDTDVINSMISGKLDWKYMPLDPPEIVDGVEYSYVTSDWYIFTLDDYPMIEKPLINTKQLSGYFTNIEDAFRYIEQLEA